MNVARTLLLVGVIAPVAYGLSQSGFQHTSSVRSSQWVVTLETLAPPLPLLALRGGGKAIKAKQAEAPAQAARGGALSMLLRVGSMLSIYGLMCFAEHLLATQ